MGKKERIRKKIHPILRGLSIPLAFLGWFFVLINIDHYINYDNPIELRGILSLLSYLIFSIFFTFASIKGQVPKWISGDFDRND